MTIGSVKIITPQYDDCVVGISSTNYFNPLAATITTIYPPENTAMTGFAQKKMESLEKAEEDFREYQKADDVFSRNHEKADKHANKIQKAKLDEVEVPLTILRTHDKSYLKAPIDVDTLRDAFDLARSGRSVTVECDPKTLETKVTHRPIAGMEWRM